MDIDSKHIRLYPKASDVFGDNIDLHKKYLLPMLSVNLQAFGGPDLWIHAVIPAEVPDGAYGDQTTEFWSDDTRDNMIGFDVVSGKYKLRGSFDYFYLHGEHEVDYYSKEECRDNAEAFLEEFLESKEQNLSDDEESDDGGFLVDPEDTSFEEEFGEAPTFVVDGYKFGASCWVGVYYEPDRNVAMMAYSFD